MNRWRFSLRSALIGISVLSFAMAALVNANSWWWSLVYTGSFLTFVAAWLTALFARDATRAFAVGVVLASVFYMLHYYAPFLLSDQLYNSLAESWPEAFEGEDAEFFPMIWHTLWGGPISLFGGCTARCVYLASRRKDAPASDPARSSSEGQPEAPT